MALQAPSLGLHVSSALQELACCRTRCTARPFFFCPSEPWLVLPIWFTWLVCICQCLASGTEVDAPKDHMPCAILNRIARAETLPALGPVLRRGASQGATQALKPVKHTAARCRLQLTRQVKSDAPRVLTATSTRFHPGSLFQISAVKV